MFRRGNDWKLARLGRNNQRALRRMLIEFIRRNTAQPIDALHLTAFYL